MWNEVFSTGIICGLAGCGAAITRGRTNSLSLGTHPTTAPAQQAQENCRRAISGRGPSCMAQFPQEALHSATNTKGYQRVSTGGKVKLILDRGLSGRTAHLSRIDRVGGCRIDRPCRRGTAHGLCSQRPIVRTWCQADGDHADRADHPDHGGGQADTGGDRPPCPG
jgi:hypothetical protein